MPNIETEHLVEGIKEAGILKSDEIIKAFWAVDRADFVPEDYKENAYLDEPVPIPFGITTSQPSTIAFMLELLDPSPGERILEVGTGSGYVTALLAEIVGPAGWVFSIEITPELKDFAEKNLSKYNYPNIYLYEGDGKDGIPGQAPFDKMISGAEVANIPLAWEDQLKPDGTIVTPYDNHVLKASKISGPKFKREEFPYFSFVRMK